VCCSKFLAVYQEDYPTISVVNIKYSNDQHMIRQNGELQGKLSTILSITSFTRTDQVLGCLWKTKL